MANIKSQKKRILTNEKAHKRNVAVKSGLKTAVRATREAIEFSNGPRKPFGLRGPLRSGARASRARV